MKYIEAFMDIELNRDTAIALGKFDGVHLGHQKLIHKICEKEGLESVVVTIWPNPEKPALLTLEEKKKIFRDMGVSSWIDFPFLPEISGMEPEVFVREILVKRLKVKYLVVGTDYHFGHNRKGDVTLLQNMQEECGFTLEIVEKETYQGREISSTYIREALEAGDMELVNRLLGYPFSVRGEVLHGRKIGRTLGMPTTNLIPSARKLLPPNGVYATKTILETGEYPGITNIGYKPTIGEYFRGVETYIFNFDSDLYGKTIEVQLHSFEREERKFETIEELKEQMHSDIRFGRLYFGGEDNVTS